MTSVGKSFDNEGEEIEEANVTTESLLNFVDLAGSERLVHNFDNYDER